MVHWIWISVVLSNKQHMSTNGVQLWSTCGLKKRDHLGSFKYNYGT